MSGALLAGTMRCRLLFFLATGCATAQVRGRVVRCADRTPIGGADLWQDEGEPADLHVQAGAERWTTWPDGTFMTDISELELRGRARYSITARAPGFEGKRQEFSYDEEQIEICLEPAATTPPASEGDPSSPPPPP